MNIVYSALAKKYAKAFLQVVGDLFVEDDFEAVIRVRKFLEHNKGLLFFFSVPLVRESVLDKGLKILFEDCVTNTLLQKLTMLLVQHKRAFLLPSVLEHIESLFREKKSCMLFMIKSSHQLNDKNTKLLVPFLEKKTGKSIRYKHVIDKSLIAGIRLQNNTLLWEYSVKKQLNDIQRSFIDMGE